MTSDVTTPEQDWTLTGGQVVTPDGVLPGAAITVRAGQIAGIGAGAAGATLDVTGLTVLPGFIDLHIHGAGGADAHAGKSADLAAFLPRCGVTAFLPTLAADAEDRTLAALRAIAAAQAAQANGAAGGARILGAHLEGPFLNPQRAGAIRPEYMHPAEPARLERLLGAAPGAVRLMTIAPDALGALALIPELARRGIVASIGHTAADYDLVRQAAAAGARHTTHLFNAMLGIHHRQPGTAGAALTDDRLTIELIADGEHVHPAILALAIRAKGPERVALVSDAVGPAGLPPGDYQWFGKEVHSDGVTVRLPDGTLAGSLGTLDRAFRTITAPVPIGAGMNLVDAAQLLATTPARILGLSNTGHLAPGCAADLVALDADGQVRLTIIAGRIAYDAR
ncbi:MAG TPA: N-acetylglucosamine-6-phosphate deacetylase [Thermomicrobiales bacterium]|nr:N-acetylglucosamine-6-phosphate deacetylase [Thermomicrobiales bacterium]